MGDHSVQSGLAWSPMMGGMYESLEDQKDVGGSMQYYEDSCDHQTILGVDRALEAVQLHFKRKINCKLYLCLIGCHMVCECCFGYV